MDNTVSTDIIKCLEQARDRSATDFGTFINEEDLVGVCEDRFYEGVAYALDLIQWPQEDGNRRTRLSAPPHSPYFADHTYKRPENKDVLTGVRNKEAFEQECQRIEGQIADGYEEFGIVMVNLNYLSSINEEYGREKGDLAIKKLCVMICFEFDHSPVFRVDGDEFVAILRGQDLTFREEHLHNLEQELWLLDGTSSLRPWERISAAVGAAAFDANLDSSFADVCRRAEAMMRENKQQMKGGITLA